MKAKRIFQTAVLVLIAVFLFSSSAVAADKALVYADKISTKPNSIFFVPVNVKGNPGLMGFKLTVSYDKEVLSLPVVTRGTVTQGGMLNDSIGVTDEGTFDIVWTNDSAVTSDGTLLVLSFNVDDTDAKNTNLKLSYSQNDTFDESYNDVVFDCKDIDISFGGEEISNAYVGEIKEPDYSDIIVSVDAALKELNFSLVNEIDPDLADKLLESANNTLNLMTGKENHFADVDSLVSGYKDAVAKDFVNTSLEAVDPDIIKSAVSDALTQVNAESIEKIPEDKKQNFVQSVENALKNQAADIDGISDTLSADEAIGAIAELDGENAEQIAQGKKVPLKGPENSTVIIIVAAGAGLIVIIAVAVIVVLHKKRKLKNNEEAIKK
ncbi:MAG: hypothetical protein IKJ27_01690 [Clostridia bacterium]|nr:hypothetical protein [Clostridia bacterium]